MSRLRLWVAASPDFFCPVSYTVIEVFSHPLAFQLAPLGELVF